MNRYEITNSSPVEKGDFLRSDKERSEKSPIINYFQSQIGKKKRGESLCYTPPKPQNPAVKGNKDCR